MTEGQIMTTAQENVTGAEELRARFERIPIMRSLGLVLESAGKGTATMRLPYRRELEGVYESMHGGLMMTLADTVACVAVMTLAGTEAAMTTTDMNIRFLSACRSDCIAEATIVKFGRTLVPVDVKLRDEQGKLLATAQVTYMRLGK